jgi:hypothetical protein
LNRKLLILNLALVAAVAWAGVRLRNEYKAAKARETATMSRKAAPSASPNFTPVPHPGPVLAHGYVDIAQKMLLDRSRNSTVVVETPPPPPPKPVPPLPRYHGKMSLPGEPLLVIMSSADNPQQRGIHVGDEIGEFRLEAITRDEMTLRWSEGLVRKSLSELLDRGSARAVASAAAPVAAPVAAPPPPKQVLGPGVDAGNGEKYCQPGDSLPAGAVVDGMRKVNKPTPMGSACFWVPAGQ